MDIKIDAYEIAEIVGLSISTVRYYMNECDYFPKSCGKSKAKYKSHERQLFMKSEVMKWYEIHKKNLYNKRKNIQIESNCKFKNKLAVKFLSTNSTSKTRKNGKILGIKHLKSDW